jgi:hypothetical protein
MWLAIKLFRELHSHTMYCALGYSVWALLIISQGIRTKSNRCANMQFTVVLKFADNGAESIRHFIWALSID